MKYNLSSILKSTVLAEGRKEKVAEKYDLSDDMINLLSNEDPSDNNKYLEWMAKQVTGYGNGDNIPLADRVIALVKKFHKYNQRLTPDIVRGVTSNNKIINNPKDLNVYDSIEELQSVVKVVEAKKTESEIKKEATKIYEDEDILVVVPLTTRASCKYGAGTRWCITSTGKQHFNNYTKDAVFYFITDKNSSQSIDSRNYKYALQYYHNGRKTWWDAQDSSHNEAPNFMTTSSGIKAMKVIDDYQKRAAGEILKRRIESFKLDPDVNSFSDMVGHLKENEITDVINKLIAKEGHTFNVLSAIQKHISEELKEDFINNLENLSSNNFQTIKDTLKDLQIVKIISNNPAILNSVQQTRWLDERLSHDDKNTISNNIDHSSVSNTESKVIMKKWSMSKEELEKHKSRSQYGILIRDLESVPQEEKIVKVVKVDPLDPESYKIINSLKLKTTLEKEYKLYAIKTETGLLDKYIDDVKSLSSDVNAYNNIIRKGTKV